MACVNMALDWYISLSKSYRLHSTSNSLASSIMFRWIATMAKCASGSFYLALASRSACAPRRKRMLAKHTSRTVMLLFLMHICVIFSQMTLLLISLIDLYASSRLPHVNY